MRQSTLLALLLLGSQSLAAPGVKGGYRGDYSQQQSSHARDWSDETQNDKSFLQQQRGVQTGEGVYDTQNSQYGTIEKFVDIQPTSSDLLGPITDSIKPNQDLINKLQQFGKESVTMIEKTDQSNTQDQAQNKYDSQSDVDRSSTQDKSQSENIARDVDKLSDFQNVVDTGNAHSSVAHSNQNENVHQITNHAKVDNSEERETKLETQDGSNGGSSGDTIPGIPVSSSTGTDRSTQQIANNVKHNDDFAFKIDEGNT